MIMASALPYKKKNRLSDVMAMIQVLGMDEHAHRSESGLFDELQGNPDSGSTWGSIASEHPEFFRVSRSGTHKISLIARHVLPRNPQGRRSLEPEMVGKLLGVATDLHDRQLTRAYRWTIYMPIISAITAGVVAVLVHLLVVTLTATH